MREDGEPCTAKSGNECFVVGKLLDLNPSASEPGEEQHEGGQQEEGCGGPERRICTRCGGYDAAQRRADDVPAGKASRVSGSAVVNT